MKKVFCDNNNKVNNKTEKGKPLLVTFHPRIYQKIVYKNLSLLYMNEEVRKTFRPKPMISYRNSSKIISYLIWIKLCPINRTVGGYKCGNKICLGNKR